MSYTVTLSEDAFEDLREVAHYIESFAPEKAEMFVGDIIDHFENVLGQFPHSGKLYLKQIRKLTYKKHTAFYIVDDEYRSVEILHVIDLAKPLEERGIDLG
ncbi:type II toxin-antitoxin system RelE/ParE family toxin [Leucothrix pacifica]|uniref:type II toxin-antitoxin system RelE/ParE family toxin n=1 Tax=Leucothrix pacifica TaxID=1247513 RepID=UPI0015E8534D|nr:type II toxin-antitoxin system RelE/ParE family toxin [Leucothrix pacifica]